MTNEKSDFDLTKRSGLPDALRALLTEYPRAGWEENPNYSQLIAFWLDRHLMFRRLNTQLLGDAEAMLDKRDDPDTYRRKLHRFGGMLIGELHGHHQIEDAHYFPVMSRLDTGLARGFDILDRDHHQMDALLSALAESANAVLKAGDDITDPVAEFHRTISGFAPMLDRHLVDEEDLVVPVLLKYAPLEFR
ncbi:hemerythrin domain-containing protein [Sulfitobacter sp. HNIBRBA3233]|uniref:hemerythrin domain-containing protein n=1 Tax=Sulfitobacter marinivivus TaxID=3158558 RepID=UPI0032DF03A1